ncbi:DUF2892 domain-containing protein [Rhodobacteraceae bacterium WD3A24]|nr:DUF2892 domain-containing protein [Rhodobacteraceae bacterium WD3A24]
MFKQNVGPLDRVLRVVVGLVLLAGFFVFPESPYRWVLLIGLIPLITGLVSVCPIYAALGMSTCPADKR